MNREVDAAAAALLGAGISGAVALGSQFVGAWLSSKHQQVQRRGERIARFMANSQSYILAVGQVARAELGQKAELESRLVWKYMDRVIDALSEIQLHEPAQLAKSFEEVDALLGELIGVARLRQFERQEWRDTRDQILGDRLPALRQAARTSL